MAPVRVGILRRDGGIVSLGAFVAEHAEAIEYDLLTKAGHELRDIGRTLSWNALASFILYVDTDSALARELNEEYSLWATQLKTNGILADIFDMLAQINANLVAIGTHDKSKPFKPYPRPGMEETRENVKHFGKGALPKGEFRKWLERKREERKQNVGND